MLSDKDKVRIHYDGSRGPEVFVQFRNPGRAARFSAGETKDLPAAEARDVLNPLISGGGFSRVSEGAPEADHPSMAEPADLVAAPPAKPRRKGQSGGDQ